MMRKGESKPDILSGLHEAIARRVISQLKRVGIVEGSSITGGIARNAGVVAKIREKLNGVEISNSRRAHDRRCLGGTSVRPRPGQEAMAAIGRHGRLLLASIRPALTLAG
jgi:hypothetical protein